MIKEKQIHFYTNLCNEEQVSEWDLETMCTDVVSTKKAIDEMDTFPIVKTTQLSLLGNAWNYIDEGIRVFIHNGTDVLEVKEHMDIPAMGEFQKDVKRGNRIDVLLLGGTFGELK